MAERPESQRWLNFEKVTVLVLEQSAYGQKILEQMLRGFGVRRAFGAQTVEQAMALTYEHQFDLVFADPGFNDARGLEFVRWLRRADDTENRFTPIILMLAHTTLNSVTLSRNTGVNIVVAKPCTPKTLLDRILWVARDKRPYVEVGDYVGPDRRFKMEHPPDGAPGRRARDKSALSASADLEDVPSDQQKVA